VLTYKGAATAFDAFWAANALGTASGSGFIVERRGRNQGMYPEIQITVALPPDFEAYTLARSRATKSTSKGANVATTVILRGYKTVEAKRSISFISPQFIYSYWKSTMPTGPRFTSPSESAVPAILSDRVDVNGDELDDSPSLPAEHKPPKVHKKTYYGGIPTPLVGDLTMPASGLISGHTADPIPRTPWYRCTDTIDWVYKGEE
jgi:hypothetical protein